jgi:hypothetical protein
LFDHQQQCTSLAMTTTAPKGGRRSPDRDGLDRSCVPPSLTSSRYHRLHYTVTGHDLLLLPRRSKMVTRTGAAIVNRAPARSMECRVDDDGALLLCSQCFRHCHQRRHCRNYRNVSFVIVVVVVDDSCRCGACTSRFLPFYPMVGVIESTCRISLFGGQTMIGTIVVPSSRLVCGPGVAKTRRMPIVDVTAVQRGWGDLVAPPRHPETAAQEEAKAIWRCPRKIIMPIVILH